MYFLMQHLVSTKYFTTFVKFPSFQVRSPLLSKSLLISFPLTTEMFHFVRFLFFFLFLSGYYGFTDLSFFTTYFRSFTSQFTNHLDIHTEILLVLLVLSFLLFSLFHSTLLSLFGDP
jgi:hypothetical protein